MTNEACARTSEPRSLLSGRFRVAARRHVKVSDGPSPVRCRRPPCERPCKHVKEPEPQKQRRKQKKIATDCHGLRRHAPQRQCIPDGDHLGRRRCPRPWPQPQKERPDRVYEVSRNRHTYACHTSSSPGCRPVVSHGPSANRSPPQTKRRVSFWPSRANPPSQMQEPKTEGELLRDE